MKKSVLFGLLSVLLVFASCKSKESAYKQAYEKAKAQESAQVQVNAPVQVTPVATTPVTSDNYDQTPVRQEQVAAVSVTGTLKAYSVVCGSFSLQANAQGLKDYLVGEGYAAGIVKNVDKNMFRVIIGSYDTKAEAARAREAFKVKYPSRADFQGAWILLNK
ncbi:MAG: SPOR domain-containing protein [Bacteroidaceae bacterium]|nr:SPOR domain-containing protein [Bacteroidaceae bacterium]MBR5148944.1 SPOR domain-containing protein [Bacteroidaceae bacterium]